MTEYKPRSSWTPNSRGGAMLDPSEIEGIVYHWPGTTQNEFGVESEATVAGHIRGWYNYHVSVRGWSDIGYNFAIDQAGRVWDLRGSGRIGAHCASATNPNANHHWIGVLLILGDREEPTVAMLQACRDFRNDVFLEKFPGKTKVTGHDRIPGASTTCCGPYAFAAIDRGDMTRTPEKPEDWLDSMDPEEFESRVVAAVQKAINASAMRDLERTLTAEAMERLLNTSRIRELFREQVNAATADLNKELADIKALLQALQS